MAKLTRETIKLFGINAGGADIGVFGSLAVGSPTYSNVIATIQSLAAWSTGSQIVLARNDAYWGTHAAAAKLVVQWQGESAARLLALRAGTVDAIDNLAPTDAPSVRDNAKLALLPRAGFNTFYVNFNNRFAPFNDARVRRAMALAVLQARTTTEAPASNTIPGAASRSRLRSSASR